MRNVYLEIIYELKNIRNNYNIYTPYNVIFSYFFFLLTTNSYYMSYLPVNKNWPLGNRKFGPVLG